MRQFATYMLLFFLIALTAKVWGEEYEAQDGKHDEQLQQYYDPQRPAPRHGAEAFIVEEPYGPEFVYHGLIVCRTKIRKMYDIYKGGHGNSRR